MLHYIYTRSPISIILFAAAALTAWGALPACVAARRWRLWSLALTPAAALTVLYATLLSRTEGAAGLVLTPFAALAAARMQPELYREMLMNIFLFLPLGMTLSGALPQGWCLRSRIALTTAVGCLLSAGIECVQYRFSLGLAETDDVICNTLGALIGSASLLIARAIEKRKERLRHTNMTLTAAEVQFVHIVRAAVSGGELPAENADWPAVFTLAEQQKLLPFVFEAARRMPAAEENAVLLAAVRLQVIRQVLHQTVRSAEFADLYRRLRAEGLHPIAVKGQLCSRLYPMKDYRISADDDLFIPEGEFMACHEALLANGLTAAVSADELSAADEVTYTKKSSPLYVELHRRLFDSSGDTYDELNRFFLDLKPVEADGFLAMPPHEHLLYLILHACKHFVRSGIGLRQFCDIGLWVRAYHGEIDWQRLHEQCESVHAATFAAAAFRIARDYLGIEFDMPEPWNAGVDAEPLLHDTLCGGVYGSNNLTRLHTSTVTLNAVRASRTGKKSSILRSVFPGREQMTRRYPYLEGHPYLLPAAWVQRLVRYAGEKRSGADNSAYGSVKMARERIELMKRYGIIGEKSEWES